MSTFVTNVLLACDLESQEEDVAGFEIRFDWLHRGEQVLIVKRKVEDSFAELLEVVDEAPCWGDQDGEETGKCMVWVKVVLRNGGGWVVGGRG